MALRRPRFGAGMVAVVLGLSSFGWSPLERGGIAVAQMPQPGTPPQPGLPPQPGTPPQPGQVAPAPAPTGPSAGGLTAPAPIEESGDDRSETERSLDEAKEEDSERGLTWFWADVEGGYQHIGLETFEVDESNLTGGLVSTEGNGGYVGVGLGAQLVWFTIGPRFRVGFFESWQVFTIGGELGFRIPVGIFEPHIELGGGYAALGSLGGALEGRSDAIDIRGGYGRVSGGLDIFIGEVFSIGPAVSWEFMALTRPGIPLSPEIASICDSDPEGAEECALAAEGSGVGSAIGVGARLGLHF